MTILSNDGILCDYTLCLHKNPVPAEKCLKGRLKHFHFFMPIRFSFIFFFSYLVSTPSTFRFTFSHQMYIFSSISEYIFCFYVISDKVLCYEEDDGTKKDLQSSIVTSSLQKTLAITGATFGVDLEWRFEFALVGHASRLLVTQNLPRYRAVVRHRIRLPSHHCKHLVAHVSKAKLFQWQTANGKGEVLTETNKKCKQPVESYCSR